MTSGQGVPLTVGIDIGGTSIRAAVVDAGGTIVDSVRAQTPKSVESLEQCLDWCVRDLGSRHSIAAVGLAVAGFINRDRTRVQFAPHLPWRAADVPAAMTRRVQLPVVLEHDANAAAWAEREYGAARSSHVTCIVALGTGIGAALLVDGELFRGAYGVAPELGHLQMVPGGRACPCGKYGCWERYCSGTALVDTAIELMADGHDRGTLLARALDADPGSLTGRRVAAAAEAGDPIARAAMADFAQWLGTGLALVSDVFDPDLIVLSGGVGASSRLYLDEAREHYSRLMTGGAFRKHARIRATQLGESAGMIGAAALARRAVTSTARI